MKKLLASLMSVTLLTSVASTVVSCARGPRMQQITTKFNEKQIGSVEYNESELWTAFNGSTATFYGVSSPLKYLSRNILNLLGFNETLITNPKFIKEFREFYMGNDVVKGPIESQPSVDGIFYGQNVINMAQDVFYNQYTQTQINSIAGLYALYQYDQINPGKITASGAANSLNAIQGSFTNNSTATQEFINSFLDLNNQNYDSAWISQKYNFGENADLSTFKLNSRITPFQQDTTTEDGVTTNKLTFTGEKDLGTPTDFTVLNTGVEATPDAKIGNNKSEPFDLLMLPPMNIDDIANSSSQALFDLSWTYDKDKANGNEAWDMRQSDDIDDPTKPKPWTFTATDKQITEEENAKRVEIGYVKTNESMVVKLAPIQVQYEYSTNARDDSAAKYIVNLTIDGAYAVFNPVRYTSNFKEASDGDTHGNRFIKWQFSHYQFNNINNVYSIPGNKVAKEAEKGYFSGLKITKMTVQNA